MAKISGWFWLIIGIAMALFSIFIQSKTDNSKLILFLIAGIVFIIIGVFKLIKAYITGEELGTEPVGTKPVPESNPDYDKMMLKKQMLERQMQQKNVVACKHCGTRHYSTSNFCHMCGLKLK